MPTQMASGISVTKKCKKTESEDKKMLQNGNNNGNEIKLDWRSLELVQEAQARKAQEATMEIENDFEEAYDDWKYRFADALYEFISTGGIAILWFLIVIGAFHWGIYTM